MTVSVRSLLLTLFIIVISVYQADARGAPRGPSRQAIANKNAKHAKINIINQINSRCMKVGRARGHRKNGESCQVKGVLQEWLAHGWTDADETIQWMASKGAGHCLGCTEYLENKANSNNYYQNGMPQPQGPPFGQRPATYGQQPYGQQYGGYRQQSAPYGASQYPNRGMPQQQMYQQPMPQQGMQYGRPMQQPYQPFPTTQPYGGR
mmetsp:Transcript_24187/g.29324  ORF Transcript_24187/g.29324 Transcript_24187/m.29324 type:complete len:207 (-) Transcript_24187:102-722(-)|eukprot:CAMPEP_0197850292 /NCGR_PEP_ID=MMETSP1438-20131217/14920_1 /TAXON_ID=1461541 /ORGANISM="Pterosperma sp., Strain CCMP1384" /LENGTH=206 /DNA_ID=CAMNT_0043463377 /DNA_START=164 /DNA_END=784 /DNA_ORIENTATION=+